MTPAVALPQADEALLIAIQAWGSGCEGSDGLLALLEPAWSERLRPGLKASELSPKQACAALAELHALQARPDPTRVHPSWWQRALQDESAAVRATVARLEIEEIRHSLFSSGTFDAPEVTAVPEAEAWALALWAERLVGDAPAMADDPPVVKALTRLQEGDLKSLLVLLGLSKHAFAIGSVTGPPEVPVSLQARYLKLLRSWGEPREFVALQQAGRDLEAVAGEPPGQSLLRLGLVTVARLLGVVEPHRFRWVLQHLPYSLARQVRVAAVVREGESRQELERFERQVWEAAVGGGERSETATPEGGA